MAKKGMYGTNGTKGTNRTFINTITTSICLTWVRWNHRPLFMHIYTSKQASQFKIWIHSLDFII